MRGGLRTGKGKGKGKGKGEGKEKEKVSTSRDVCFKDDQLFLLGGSDDRIDSH